MRATLLLPLLLCTTAATASGPSPAAAPAQRFGEAIVEGKADTALALFDTDALTDEAVRGLKVPAEFVATLRDGQRKTASSLVGQLIQNVAQGASFRLLRVAGGKSTTSIYRQHSDSGLAYFEFTWRVGDGPVRIVDVRPLAGATSFAEDARRLAIVAAAQADPESAKRLSPADQLYVKHLPTYTTLARSMQAGRHQEALAAWESLPKELQREKLALIFRINAARMAGDQGGYVAAMDDLLRFHAKDPAIVLPSLDLLFARGEYPRLLKALNALDQRVGGDPYLEVMRNTVYVKQGNAAAGRKALQRATQREPTLREPWAALLDVAVREGNHAETSRLLDASAKGANVDWSDVATAEVFGAFRGSPEGKAWLKRQPKR